MLEPCDQDDRRRRPDVIEIRRANSGHGARSEDGGSPSMKAIRTMKPSYLCWLVVVVLCALVSPALAQQAASGSDNTPNAQRAPLWGQNPKGMHVYIRAGLKTHGPGLHDYPQFLADWSKILTDHGAVVDGSLHAPSAAELEHADVLVIDKGDTGFMTDGEKAALEGFIKRGGGIVSIHDALCGPDPAYFATLVGGGKKQGQINYALGADIPYTIVDRSNPLMEGMSDITIFDEAFYNMTWSKGPPIHVLATVVIPGTPSD